MTKLNFFYSVGLLLALFACETKNTLHPNTEALWVDKTDHYLNQTEEWTNRVEVADLNGDKMPDIIFANGGNYSQPGKPEFSRVFINKGNGEQFEEITSQVFGNEKYISRVIKVRDINKDNIADMIVGTTYESQSQLYIGLGNGVFKNVTEEQFPAIPASIGDLELGDVDADGDLDIVLSNWGPGNNMKNAGGITMLWLNDGNGYFEDVTSNQMPKIPIQFSWDIEFFDFDNDFDLDIAISCKRCATSRIFVNDGAGFFEDKRLLPAYTNNYELEPMDVDNDGFLDLVTINDGEIVGGKSYSRREHLFLNIEGKRFIDATFEKWPDAENIGEDDNNIVFLDYDSDNDPDFLISSLTGEDRLLVNDGNGNFSLIQPVLSGNPTPLTLSMVLADLNNDKKLDIIMGQGEGDKGIEERIFIAHDLKPDTAGPIISHFQVIENNELKTTTVMARIHDNKSPNMPHDWLAVDLIVGDSEDTISLTWYGENLWTATIATPETNAALQICATDFAGNKSCTEIN